MNILILSAGTRNGVVSYFKRALGGSGKVICTDMSRVAPAVYEADGFYQVPRVTEPGYVDEILSICEAEKIDGVLSLIDPELSIIAERKDDFAARGTVVIGSSCALCERALDKMQMFRWLRQHRYLCAVSYDDLDDFRRGLQAGEISFPVFVKPVHGSASQNIGIVRDMEELEFRFSHGEDLMVQQYLRGQEIGADVYIDLLSGEVVSIFTKKKLLMRAGETDKSVSFKDERLFALIEQFVRESGWRGQIDIDLYEVDGEYYISEVNPRFGGGYPHAHECGCNHVEMILNNLRGRVNDRRIGQYEDGVYMMKYSDYLVKKL